MLADIFITFKDRSKLFQESLISLVSNTPRELYRLTVICDNGYIPEFLYQFDIDHCLVHKKNLGLGPSINQAFSHIQALNQYYEHPKARLDKAIAPFICYNQDDLIYEKDWLQTLVKFFTMFEQQKKLGFASGVECIEHKVREELGEIHGRKIVTKDWIRAAQMFGRREYWMSMFPIPRFDPETQNIRARPHNGMGSGVDWWFIRNHENSICKSGRTCLVIPGLVKHLGYKQSTWLDREMPESEEDKKELEKLEPLFITRLDY